MTIKGNNKANKLLGTKKADKILGLGGDDTIDGRAGNDQIYGGEGNDRISGNAGDDRLYGDAGNDVLRGGEGNDSLFGGAGNDRLAGGRGTNTLTGGAGNDAFVFADKLGYGIDTITDFHNKAGDNDFFQLDNAVFAKLTKTGQLAAALFEANAAGVASDADTRIVYETDTGKLFYDADGSGKGKAVQFATLSGHPALTNKDFTVI